MKKRTLDPETSSDRHCSVFGVIGNCTWSGKTFTATNLAVSLTERRKRVLIVDLDPLCSATKYFKTSVKTSVTTSDVMNQNVEREPDCFSSESDRMLNSTKFEPSSLVEDSEEPFVLEGVSSLLADQILLPVLNGKMLNVTDIYAVLSENIDHMTINPDLFLLAGSEKLEDISSKIDNELQRQGQFPVGLFSALAFALAEILCLDCVIFDMDGKVDTVHMLVASSCDFLLGIFKPAVLQSTHVGDLDTISFLSKWVHWSETKGQTLRREDRNEFKDAVWSLPMKKPIVLPILINFYFVDDRTNLISAEAQRSLSSLFDFLQTLPVAMMLNGDSRTDGSLVMFLPECVSCLCSLSSFTLSNENLKTLNDSKYENREQVAEVKRKIDLLANFVIRNCFSSHESNKKGRSVLNSA